MAPVRWGHLLCKAFILVRDGRFGADCLMMGLSISVVSAVKPTIVDQLIHAMTMRSYLRRCHATTMMSYLRRYIDVGLLRFNACLGHRSSGWRRSPRLYRKSWSCHTQYGCSRKREN